MTVGFYDNDGVEHSLVPRSEWRTDRFGQVVSLHCKCGMVTNWHTSTDRAYTAMYEIHKEGKYGEKVNKVQRPQVGLQIQNGHSL